jgi:magnesium transporter
MAQRNNEYRAQSHNDVTWVDLENPAADILADLEKTYDLHPIHIRESLQKVQHLRVEREENYLFLVLHVPVIIGQKEKIHTSQVGVFLGKNFLITIRSGASPCITDAFEVCNLSSEKAKDYFKSAPFLLFRLIANLLNNISDMADDLNNELDEIEDLVFDNRNSDSQRIGKVRQKIVRLSRVIGPKRLVLHDLAEQIGDFDKPDMVKYYRGNYKLASKLWEEIEEAKETVEVYKDADFTSSTEKTNRILAILTLVFTFTIPVTVAGTLYGMNVLLPGGVQTGEWTFWGRYTTFIIIVAGSGAVAGVMYWYFKRKKWF